MRTSPVARLAWALLTVGCGSSRLSAGDDVTVAEGELVFFAPTLDGAPASVEWAFGDGVSAEGSLAASHAYADEGTYSATVTTVTTDGASVSDTVVVTVTNAPPSIAGENEDRWATGVPYRLRGIVSDPGLRDAVSATIDWGDGEVEVVPTEELTRTVDREHVYDAEGDLEILVALDDGDGGMGESRWPVRLTDGQRIVIDARMTDWTIAGERWIGVVSATALRPAAVTLSLATGPSELAFDPETGIAIWTPSAAQAGEHDLVFRATDGVVTEERTFHLTVASPTPAASATITSAGGILEVSSGPLAGLRIDFPPGAVATDTEITIATVSPEPEAPRGHVGPMFAVLPEGLSFGVPVTISIPYDPARIPPGFDDSSLMLADYSPPELVFDAEGSTWMVEPTSTVDAVSHTLRATRTHFSLDTVIAKFRSRQSFTSVEGHFTLLYEGDSTAVDAPLFDCVGTLAPPLCYRPAASGGDPGVPDLVEDYARGFELAYAAYGRGGYLLDAQYTAVVGSFPGYLGIAHFDGRFAVSADTGVPREIAAHELFHMAQRLGVYGNTRHDPSYELFRWAGEATANDMCFELYPDQRRSPSEERFLLFGDVKANGGYPAFPLFKHARTRRADDLTWRLFNGSTSWLRDELASDDTPRSWFYRFLTEVFPDADDRARFWVEFALSFQYARYPSWISGIDRWTTRPGRGPVDPTSIPSGLEREMSDPMSEAPRDVPAVHSPLPQTALLKGSVATHVIDLRRVLCDTPGADVGEGKTCVGTDGVEDPMATDLILRLTGGVGFRGTLYELAGGTAVIDEPPEVLAEVTGGSTFDEVQDLWIPLRDIAPGAVLALSVVHEADSMMRDPLQVSRLQVEVYFRPEYAPDCAKIAVIPRPGTLTEDVVYALIDGALHTWGGGRFDAPRRLTGPGPIRCISPGYAGNHATFGRLVGVQMLLESGELWVHDPMRPLSPIGPIATEVRSIDQDVFVREDGTVWARGSWYTPRSCTEYACDFSMTCPAAAPAACDEQRVFATPEMAEMVSGFAGARSAVRRGVNLLVVDEDGQLSWTGKNRGGQAGDGTLVGPGAHLGDVTVPVQPVVLGARADQIAAQGAFHFLARARDTLYAWGGNFTYPAAAPASAPSLPGCPSYPDRDDELCPSRSWMHATTTSTSNAECRAMALGCEGPTSSGCTVVSTSYPAGFTCDPVPCDGRLATAYLSSNPPDFYHRPYSAAAFTSPTAMTALTGVRRIFARHALLEDGSVRAYDCATTEVAGLPPDSSIDSAGYAGASLFHLRSADGYEQIWGVGDGSQGALGPSVTTSTSVAVQVAGLVSGTCDDGMVNGEESDTDCGGSRCEPCAPGARCMNADDCDSRVCTASRCVTATCFDSVENGLESDIDCGGSGCPTCPDGSSCGTASDCQSGVCTSSICRSSCTDGVRNGSETDIDCGGGCAPCANGRACVGTDDCAGALCTSMICRACTSNGDCSTLYCSAGACRTPTCTDGVRNGTESDIDCGGTVCGRCADGRSCGAPTDCASGTCTSGTCAACSTGCGVPASCSNGSRDGLETDTDCGGAECLPCAGGRSCSYYSDCASLYCYEYFCSSCFGDSNCPEEAPTCAAGLCVP